MGPERAGLFFKRIDAAAAALDVEIKWTGKLGSTRPSHRLIRLARDKDAEVAAAATAIAAVVTGPSFQERILTAVFEGQFVDGRDVSDPVFLAGIAVAAGLADDEARVRAWLDDARVCADV